MRVVAQVMIFLGSEHVKWIEFNDEEINAAYEKKLASLGIADTLWYIGSKKESDIL